MSLAILVVSRSSVRRAFRSAPGSHHVLGKKYWGGMLWRQRRVLLAYAAGGGAGPGAVMNLLGPSAAPTGVSPPLAAFTAASAKQP
ncbi:hypothetical protein [Pararhizobium sp. A13]|uniref:hypothetical protein n=1 Tax=Pararhizobium sp. A13 TaxID=3133975 RepID=UPI0032DB1A5B